MKKATKHRKRHTIPGPAGVLWSSSNPDEKSNHVRGGGGEEDEGLTQQPLFSNNRNGDNSNDNDNKYKRTKNNHGHHHDISPHAWSTMQQSLEIVTPYLPSHTQGDIKRRYELLRPHLPSNCVLLSEILRGNHDVKMTNNSNDDLFLCVWVESIDETNSHHGVFTVELRDETGAKIRAWIEPKFVKAELQKGAAQNDDKNNEKSKSSMGVVRTGVVWMLRNVSMIVFKNNNNNSNNINNSNSNNNNNSNNSNNNIGRSSLSSSITRMLVVSENNIKEVWTPEQHMAQTQLNEEDDSPEAQRKYLDWMEKRKALAVSSPSSSTKKKKKKKERRRNHPHNHDDDDDNDDDDIDIDNDDDDEGPPEEYDYERDHDHDGRSSTTNGLWNQLRTEPSSPLAHRDVNDVQEEYDSTIKTTTTTTDNNKYISNEKSQKSSDLHKQLFSMPNSASAGKDEVIDSSGSLAEEISTTMTTTHLHHPSRCSTQLETQPDSPRRKHHNCNPPNQNENLQSSMGGETTNKMHDKDCEDDANGRRSISSTMTSYNKYTQESAFCNNNNNNSIHQDRSRETTSQRKISSRSPTETIDQTIHPSSTSSSPSYENSQRKNDSTSPQDDITSKQKKQKKKTKKKKRNRDTISSATVEMTKLKKKKEAKSISPTRKVNSPIRMAGSVWNTPDASILQMLDKEEEEEEEETQTVIGESHAFPTQQRHPPLVSNIASRSGGANGIVEDPQSESEENDDESLLLKSARIEGGSCENMFEPSSWAGIDMSALSDDDDCNF
jgi:hypothetical protein